MRNGRKRNNLTKKDIESVRKAESISEEELERIESDPGFRRMMKESEEAMRAGRYVTHEEALRRIRSLRSRTR